MIPLAEVRSEWHDQTPVGVIDGEVDVSNADTVAASLRVLVTNHSTQLVVNLSQTTYLDSAGINLLFTIGEELAARQLKFKLVVPPASPIMRMLRISSLDRTYPTFATLAEAI